jgi:microcystin-dependent protein
MEPYIGEIRMAGFNFAPQNSPDWALCNGQLLSIAQNEALYSLIGTTYGGDGSQTFALPNLQGRVAVHQSSGVNMPVVLGEQGGAENVTLVGQQMPLHNHMLAANSGPGQSNSPVGGFIGQANNDMFAEASNGTMSPSALQPAGGNEAHNNMQPYLVTNFIIALQGIYPSPA